MMTTLIAISLLVGDVTRLKGTRYGLGNCS